MRLKARFISRWGNITWNGMVRGLDVPAEEDATPIGGFTTGRLMATAVDRAGPYSGSLLAGVVCMRLTSNRAVPTPPPPFRIGNPSCPAASLAAAHWMGG